MSHPTFFQNQGAPYGTVAPQFQPGQYADPLQTQPAFAPVQYPVQPNQPQPPPMVQGMPSANVIMPRMQDMGQQGWYRMPAYPTAPYMPMDSRVSTSVRIYSVGITNQPAGAEVVQTIPFDLPSWIVAMNGAAIVTTAILNIAGINPRDTFLFRCEYTNGDRFTVAPRLASTVLGTAERPGEVGGAGLPVNSGMALLIGLTPLWANLQIDVTFHAIQFRGAANFTFDNK